MFQAAIVVKSRAVMDWMKQAGEENTAQYRLLMLFFRYFESFSFDSAQGKFSIALYPKALGDDTASFL